jgi:hypothetical protein
MNTEPFTLTSDNMYMTGLVKEGEPAKNYLNGDIAVPGTFEYEAAVYRVTKIGQEAFADCRGMTSITLPDGVRSIGDSAFGRCMSLKSIALPGTITHIGKYAFEGCSSMENITIPESVKNLKCGTFSNCWSLEKVSLPKDLNAIGGIAFEDCHSLKEITVPDGITRIEPGTFMNCYSLAKVVIPDSITCIEECSFFGCKQLTDINIPEHTDVSKDAFIGCPSFEKKGWLITIANSAASDTIITHFKGTADEVQKALFNLAAEDRNNDPEAYDYGIDSPDDLECAEDGLKFTASVSYEDYHIEYTAVEEYRIEELGRDILDLEVPPLEDLLDEGIDR